MYKSQENNSLFIHLYSPPYVIMVLVCDLSETLCILFGDN